VKLLGTLLTSLMAADCWNLRFHVAGVDVFSALKPNITWPNWSVVWRL